MMNKKKIIVAITGASGSIYAKRLLVNLKKVSVQAEVSVVFTENGRKVSEYELEAPIDTSDFNVYDNNDLFAAPASGSAGYDAMIVIPCSMGTLGRIANGISADLIGRAADVMLKERKKLLLVVRETPYSLIHLNNMSAVTAAGGIIVPASPSFYNHPQTIDQLVDTVVYRCLDLMNIEVDHYKWGEQSDKSI